MQSEGICLSSLMQQDLNVPSRSSFCTPMCVSVSTNSVSVVAVVVQFLPAGKVRRLLSFTAVASLAGKDVLCLYIAQCEGGKDIQQMYHRSIT